MPGFDPTPMIHVSTVLRSPPGGDGQTCIQHFASVSRIGAFMQVSLSSFFQSNNHSSLLLGFGFNLFRGEALQINFKVRSSLCFRLNGISYSGIGYTVYAQLAFND